MVIYFKTEKSIIKMNDVLEVNGIYLVIQSDLPGSKIRGAFKVNKDIPAIYLTLKHRIVLKNK